MVGGGGERKGKVGFISVGVSPLYCIDIELVLIDGVFVTGGGTNCVLYWVMGGVVIVADGVSNIIDGRWGIGRR